MKAPNLSFRPTGGSGEICLKNPADPSAADGVLILDFVHVLGQE